MKHFVFILIASFSLLISCNNSNDGGIPSSIEGVWFSEGSSYSGGQGVFFHDEHYGRWFYAPWYADVERPCNYSTDGRLIEKDGNKYTFLDESENLEFSIFLTVDGNELTIRDNRYDTPNGLYFKEADNINQSEIGCF